MTVQQAVDALHALPRMTGAPTLARMNALLARLGHPEERLKCVHIAGTNGKGSVAAMTAAICTAAGYKTGLTVSPYVIDFRERFQIDGKMIPPRTLAALTRQVLDAADAVRQAGGDGPCEFEAVTAVALLWFARERCDLVVLETGLGGKYDATNAVPHTLVAAVTKISLDHTEILGGTLAEIAAQKAGVIKEGCVVVCYPDQPPEAMGPLLSAAADAHTHIITPEKDDIVLRRCRALENHIDYGGYQAALNFPGAHQANNAAMAVEIALALWREFGYDISDEAVLTGLEQAKMPARIEVLRRHPLLLLDGCHNPDGAAALADVLKKASYDGRLAAVIGVLADKDHAALCETLGPLFEKVYAVTPACPRALPAAELQRELKFHTDAEAARSVPAALRAAVDYADAHNLAGVAVCGSLYLAAEARPWLLREARR